MVADDGGDDEAGCVARMRGVGRGATVEEQEANAHLIAAAPLLRDACALVARCLDYGPDENPLLVAVDRKRAEVLVRAALAAAVPPGPGR
jgi:hypothetical protein